MREISWVVEEASSASGALCSMEIVTWAISWFVEVNEFSVMLSSNKQNLL
jgi:hypothetical protein